MLDKYIMYNNCLGWTRNFDNYEEALEKAKELNKINNQSYLILKLVAEVETRSMQFIEEFECD